MNSQTLGEWLEAEPFTLALSAGFFGFYAHAGLIAALEHEGLAPRRVVGSSAGAIAGGVWAAGASAAQLQELLEGLELADFWDPSWHELRPGPRLRRRLARQPRARDPGTALGLLRGRKFDAVLARALAGTHNIEDCRVPFAAVTHELRTNTPRVQTRGPIRPAIRASAALPLMFGPVRVGGRLHADGGISDRPAFSALARGERTLYHHLRHSSAWPRPSGDELGEQQPTPTRQVIVIDELPRVHPGALERGRLAFERARAQTLVALGRPL